MNNPPEGLSSDDFRRMSEDDLLDMDYFLNEDLSDEFGEDGFYIFQIRFISLLFCPLFRGLFIQEFEFPIKQKERALSDNVIKLR